MKALVETLVQLMSLTSGPIQYYDKKTISQL